MSFQAGVGTWFAAHLASEMPVGSRFGIGDGALPLRLQFETGEFLDDIVLRQSDGGSILVQCKTHPDLSARPDSAFAGTVDQLVSFLAAQRSSNGTTVDLSRTVAVLAVARDASGSLDDLEQACRFFDHGARWDDAPSHLNQAQQRALDLFATHARTSWQRFTSNPADNEDLTALARLFHVARFDVDRGGTDQREAARIVGARLFGREEAGSTALEGLSSVVRRLIRTGAPTDRSGLVQALRLAGIEDTRSPRFDRDLARLRELSAAEIQRLARHSRLPVGAGVPIPRECMPALRAAVDGGSLLVVGEPGAGKTGVLVALAEEKLAGDAPFVFMSVDRVGGVATADELRAELGLEHPLLDVLAAWPGFAPGVLIIDALDASRGGASERVFASLIEDGLARLGDRWSIVASIRTFDLRNGKRFRTIVTGTPPSDDFAEPSLNQVRHFRIPRLTDGEVGTLALAHPELGRLAESAPQSMRELLRNVFNLSLAAELIDQGVPADSIRSITTQSDLIERYEDERLPSARLQNAISEAVAVMVERRRLAVPKVMVSNDAIDDVLATGIMAPAGDRIAFAHHVLFDHAASRFYLDWDDTQRLMVQITSDPAIGFLLGPSLRFAMERVWRDDDEGRPRTWRLIAAIAAVDDLDPVVASVALRTAAEGVTEPGDVEGLCALLRSPRKSDDLGSTLSRLARFVSMSIAEASAISTLAATAWATVARAAIATADRTFADGARFLLWSLSEKANFADPTFSAAFGDGARALLEFAWAAEPAMQTLATNAIRFVCKSYATDVNASRALLERILEEPHFSEHAHEEAPWLAEGVPMIAPVDPDFAAKIYGILFGRAAPQDGPSWMGGQPSRILPLSSNRRQDYEHARWHLRQAFPAFLRAAPEAATRAVSAAAIGMAAESSRRSRVQTQELVAAGARLSVVEDYLSLDDWREARRAGADPNEDILGAYARFLRDCTPTQFRTSVQTALTDETATSVWARILGVAAERPGIADDLLWPIASEPVFLALRGISRDAIIFLAAVYPTRSIAERAAFEAALLARCRSADEDDARWYGALAERFLSTVSDHALATPDIRTLKADLAADGRLTGNRPFVSFQITSGPIDDITDRLLERDGVDLEQGPDQELRAVARPLDQLVRSWPNDAGPEQVSELWRAAARVLETIQRLDDPPPRTETLHATWGSVSNAVEKIAGAEAYNPDDEEHPSLSELLALVDRMSLSQYPEPRDDSGSGMMAWGNWDVRVYAAASLLDLARRFGDREPAFVGRLPPLLSDPVPTVRLQVAQSLNALWEVSRQTMWEMVEFVARKETHSEVLGFFVGGPLMRLSGPEPDRCEAFAAAILARQSRSSSEDGKRKRESFDEAFGHLAANLWVGRGRPLANKWIETWTADLVYGQAYLWPLISALRAALFVRFVEGTSEAVAVQERAQGVLYAIVIAASRALAEATSTLTGKAADKAERQRAENLHRAGESLLDHACNQLYFGSGAFRNGNEKEPPGLASSEVMRLFLDEYSATLDVIGQAGTPRTLHHLVELYEFAAAAAPEAVFDRVSDLLVGPAAREGYHFESLGSDVLVRLVRRYLADHRAVFDDEVRRARLVRVLELFSSAGWPEALKLLYELPDLLR